MGRAGQCVRPEGAVPAGAGPPFSFPAPECRTSISVNCFILFPCEEKIPSGCPHSNQIF